MSTSATVVAALGAGVAAPTWRSSAPPDVALVRDFVPPPATTMRGASERDAYTRGLAEGQRRATEALQADVDVQIARLSSTIADVRALRSTILKHSDKDIVTLALEMARRIVQREVRRDPALLVDLAQKAAACLAGAGVATIAMPPELLRGVGAPTDLESGPIRLAADDQLPPGACVVRAASGTIDLSVDAQIRELFDALFDPAADAPPDRLGDDAL